LFLFKNSWQRIASSFRKNRSVYLML
jgi:hypothetical protein